MTIILIVSTIEIIVSICMWISSDAKRNTDQILVAKMVTIDTINTTQASSNENAGERLRGQGIRLWTYRIVGAIAQWWRVRSTRRGLAELDEDLLRDIGITPQDARDEMKKSLYLLHKPCSSSGRLRGLPTYDRW